MAELSEAEKQALKDAARPGIRKYLDDLARRIEAGEPVPEITDFGTYDPCSKTLYPAVKYYD